MSASSKSRSSKKKVDVPRGEQAFGPHVAAPAAGAPSGYTGIPPEVERPGPADGQALMTPDSSPDQDALLRGAPEPKTAPGGSPGYGDDYTGDPAILPHASSEPESPFKRAGRKPARTARD
jgi:hypothetical protein